MSFLDSTSNLIQLLVALGGALILFVFAYSGYARVLFMGIVVMIPFQPIESKYGSINMVVTYVVGIAMLLSSLHRESKKNIKIPLIVPFALLFLAFLMSWSMAPKLFSPKYSLHLINVGSNVVLFYMSYAFITKEKDLDTFFKALIFSNALVIIYSIIQGFVGYGQLSLFGIEELSMQANRKDQRLVGPFHAVGITAEYLVIQSLILAHYMVQTGRLRWLGLILLLGNFAVLVGTGNRGGFLVALLAIILFLYFYKRYIGGRGVLLAGLGFLVMLVGSSFVMIKYTEFNLLYTRLLETEVEGITPDTRSGWVNVVEIILERPVLGHGPKIVRPYDYGTPPRKWPAGYITYYPHSLYLYILYTTGFVGLLAYVNWAVAYWKNLCRGKRQQKFTKGIMVGLSTLGMIVFVIFIIDQLKVEFLRHNLSDYQHYIAVLFGMFVAVGSIKHETQASI